MSVCLKFVGVSVSGFWSALLGVSVLFVCACFTGSLSVWVVELGGCVSVCLLAGLFVDLYCWVVLKDLVGCWCVLGIGF